MHFKWGLMGTLIIIVWMIWANWFKVSLQNIYFIWDINCCIGLITKDKGEYIGFIDMMKECRWRCGLRICSEMFF